VRRSRRFIAETTRAGLLLQLRVEEGRIDDALNEVSALDSSIYASPISWFRAWVLAEGGRTAQARNALVGYDGTIADDWFKMPLLTAGISAAAASHDVEFVRRHIDFVRCHTCWRVPDLVASSSDPWPSRSPRHAEHSATRTAPTAIWPPRGN
jgi:hypothetical protein